MGVTLAPTLAPQPADTLFFIFKQSKEYPVVGPETLMDKKAHGTCEKPVQENLRWSVDREVSGSKRIGQRHRNWVSRLLNTVCSWI